ncbi:MAG: alanine racemase [Myxococcota bacterium]
MAGDGHTHRSWAEIDRSALLWNLRLLRGRAGDRRLIAVVKADAYGHGAGPVSRALEAAGVDALAVATLDEARELRRAGVGCEILVLQPRSEPGEADALLALDALPLISRLETLDVFEASAQRVGRPARVHLKLDTGMSRLGLPLDRLDALLARLGRMPHVAVEGIASHLADADVVQAPSLRVQRERFAAALARLGDAALHPPWRHLDSSAAVLHGPTPGTTAVRVGLALYGADPTRERAFRLAPVMTLCARVLDARTLEPGARVGYGGTFVARRPTTLLTLGIGYADGLPRAAGGCFSVGLGGRRVPLVGRVSMDLATVDAGPRAPTSEGQEVLVFGRKGGQTIAVEELADAVGTLAYEILVGVGRRVPRLARDRDAWASAGSAAGHSPGSRRSGH